ncbi:hypothetical protein C2R22_01355 [Salinigranum rubrum]|uniref:Uncharacterized protein n=1 Tax=Salinigranum rubrum TaxID=755307 RepID=A0A2I8VEW5_9EURY|nr:hypothetical protein [Salinigranum rubrum]AUV80468.1 hypothetical protein C2R22_01355 [Salinigranum rubrum]
MRQPSRRAFLGTTAGLCLGVAGCLDRGRSGASPTETPTPRESSRATPEPTPTADASTPRTLGTEQPVGGVPVTVSNLAVQDSVLYRDTDDSMAVASDEGKRYVLVSVSGNESGPPPEAFALVVDGKEFEPTAFRGGIDEYGPRYDPGYGVEEGYLPFVVPASLDADEGRIAVENESQTAAWRLAEIDLDALRRPKAAFELRTVELPETLRRYDPVSVRVTAENVGDVPGTFRGVLNVTNLVAAYAPYPFALDADPGETVVWEETFREGPSRGVESVGFFLYTVGGNRERRATVRGRNETARGTATATRTETSATTTETANATETATPRETATATDS